MLSPDAGLGARAHPRRRRGSADHLDARPGAARDDLHRVRAARAAPGAGRLRGSAGLAAARADPFRVQPKRSTPTSTCSPTRTSCSSPSRCRDPDGEPAYALLHRPMWNIGQAAGRRRTRRPGSPTRGRASGSPTCRWPRRRRDLRALTHVAGHRAVACRAYDWEAVKIGAGPPPIRVPEGWLLIHHGVSGVEVEGWGPQQDLHYAAGAMLLDPADPGRVLARTPAPVARAGRSGGAAGARCPTSSSPPRSRRSTGSGSSSTAWPTPASASLAWRLPRETVRSLVAALVVAGLTLVVAAPAHALAAPPTPAAPAQPPRRLPPARR